MQTEARTKAQEEQKPVVVETQANQTAAEAITSEVKSIITSLEVKAAAASDDMPITPDGDMTIEFNLNS
jgi:hypothetical protein